MNERPSVEQAQCKSCGDESNLRETDYTMDVIEGETRSEVECRGCGETGTIMVDEEGTHASDEFTFENASWNQVESDE